MSDKVENSSQFMTTLESEGRRTLRSSGKLTIGCRISIALDIQARLLLWQVSSYRSVATELNFKLLWVRAFICSH